MYNWTTKIQYVRGIGPQKATELRGIGIETVGDLLEYQPNNHIYPGVTAIKDLKEGYAIIKAKVVIIHRLPTKVPIVQATLSDGTGTCNATWYNQHFVVQSLRPGMVVTFWGKVKAGVLQQPKFSTYGFNMDEVAGGDYGVHNRTMRIALREVLNNMEIPDWSLGGYDYLRDMAFRNLHNPHKKEHHRNAINRLKYDELFLLQLAMLKRRQQARSGGAEVIDFDVPAYPKIREYFPYKFTVEQYGAIQDILIGLRDTIPMNRLLHGEVGSGKTAVAFYCAMLTALNNKRTLILAPTTILAQQHYDTLRGMGWGDVGLYYDYKEDGRSDWNRCANIIIGTHAILNNTKLIKSASLVIIDEFQKFGVEQRAKLQKYNPHTLLMSATPIPRTLAMLKRRQQHDYQYDEKIKFSTSPEMADEILSYFPYEFTSDQTDAANEILQDLFYGCPMNRLLHGEVGSGKTAVAFYAAMLAALNGKRTLILCPTTILAQQHYDTLRGMGWGDVQLHQTGVDCGTHKIVIGTHSLLNADYLLSSASLVIVDEFQKFGVEQRAKLQKHNPHTLLMSATPIPRTLAMSVFGDLDISTIKELPIKRGTIITRWVLP